MARRRLSIRSATAPRTHRNPISAAAGIGLRFQHHQAVVDERPDVAWFEVHTENYMGGGTSLNYLDLIRRDYPIAVHGVGLSLGSAEGLDPVHLERIRRVVERCVPALVSEHLSWSVVDGTYLADLLPLPMTEEALDVVCRHVEQTQTYLRRQILIENPSTYLRYRHATIPEWEFLAAVANRTGCGTLCDVNNIYVSACNHGWDASAYLAALPPEAVGEIHLAGHTVRELDGGRTLRIDDHSARVAPEVWTLYGEALARFGPVPTLVEWDTNVPPLKVLLEEAAQAAILLERAENGAYRYLADVARLEWAVNRALHALDVQPLDLELLADVDAVDHPRVRFAPHPSVSLLRASYPCDIIWRAVLEQDDATLGAIDLTEAPLWLMVQRLTTGVEVTRMSEPAWHFLAQLCAGRTLQDAIDAVPTIDAPALLAGHLVAGRFIGFSVTDDAAVQQPLESGMGEMGSDSIFCRDICSHSERPKKNRV